MTVSGGQIIPAKVWIEACENYQKQSYRNRCKICSSRGVENLNVNVVHENGTFSLPIREIKVDYSTPWISKTERAIEAAYGSSPFFPHYRDALFAILESRHERLFDLDLAIIRWMTDKLGLKAEFAMTGEFSAPGESIYGKDLRSVIHPKKSNSILSELGLDRPYYQVFSQRFGFVPNLSAIDLLFNEGPDSVSYLLRI